jgi:hypothetical protein
MSPRDDRDLIERQLRPWLAEEGMVREPKDLFERVASGTRGVRQRPAWLVRLLGNGSVGAGAGPAARWREHRMATALGLGTIVVVAALAVGSLGPGQPTGVVPGAVTESPSPSASPEYMVEVTGDFTREDVQSYGSTTEEDGIYHTRGPWWKITWEASDPRLSGTGTYVSNWNEVVASGLSYGADNYILVNQDGRWAGTSLVFGSPGDDELLVLQGEGAYEGLTAYVQIPATSGQKSFNAIITNGEPVEIPEPVEPPAE